ncbi:MAG: hypothetical protein JGK24_06155 [Microcoleus sp. PH2017_29_MFU_D_A]|uniref:hypothetical protein n=1 Tax=unclassified Microcoleus TaxID=2642155 RepID=UPI001DA33FEF|nr:MULTISPECIES: hypothetical protein [unclassified Microcoleus]MCC3421907.1 hypothetical protein [Microcoleus sp. PH2017_07_MST_O_A]MCC3430099.1 hypothetical protein [Microcoleus sp. PH2017_04_SCI_O_A]MCC3440585.1 hypothetical protein [Microcoleus sp. PH2017_03_ELD_O_A]MCC3466682.1 hypothetical protein [Microcoleus sp. PH2017_06_SFM_O_A]MCC3502614.1 hypothetical protein [Microcoleus sp. PH2017_19_SFW_U_A]MCC3509306.1 hypothetical protein [Microcoleus sp. PH2017_17_BER_D_A]MCC3639924.1 hypot
MQPHGSSTETEQQRRGRSNSTHRTSATIDHTYHVRSIDRTIWVGAGLLKLWFSLGIIGEPAPTRITID